LTIIKLFDPNFDSEEEKALLEVLRSGFWASGAGKGKVYEFEENFRNYVNCTDCVAVNNGTSALHLALSQLNIRNKEVLVPSLTFVSTVSMIQLCGGKVVFVDVEEDTLCIDVKDVEGKISNNTICILPVHFGGMPCNLKKITKISNENKVAVVEDAAHACGAQYQGTRIGSHSDIVCFSFHPVKNLAMPTGGAITLNGSLSEKRKSILKSQRWCGIENRIGLFYDVPRIGWNYYMNEFSAAIGLSQLKKLDKMNERRRNIAKLYNDKINLENKMPFIQECAYHLYWIRVNNRIDFIKKVNDAGIEVGIHYKPVHQMSMYRSDSNLEITNKVSPEIVSLPMHSNLSNDEVSFVIEKVNQFAE